MGDRSQQRGHVTRRRVLAAGGGTVAGSLVLGASWPEFQDDTPDKPESGGTLRLALAERPASLDPLVDDVPPGLATLVFGGLYGYGESTGLVPNLAADEPSIDEDRQEYVVEIDERARFQHDEPVTAADVVYSFEMASEEGTDRDGAEATDDPTRSDERDEIGASRVESPLSTVLESVEEIDDQTVRFTLSEAYTPFRHLLTGPVVPRDLREDDPDQFASQPTGTGPFEVLEGSPDSELRLWHWDDYWGDPQPTLQAIELPVIEGSTERLTALTSGESNVMETVSPDLYPDVAEADDAELREQTALEYVHLAFNCRSGFTADPLVREAIDYCISPDEFIANFVEPAGERMYSPIPPPLAADWDFPVGDWEAISREYDVDAARDLFEEVGVPGDWTATILVPDENVFEQLALTVANGLREAGYGAMIDPVDAVTFQERRVTGDSEDYDLYVDRWTGLPDPDAFVYPLFAEEAEGETNGTYFRSDSVQDKLETARRALRREERQPLYADAITTILEDRAHLPVFSSQYSFAVGEEVQDFRTHPVDRFRLVSEFNNVSVDEE